MSENPLLNAHLKRLRLPTVSNNYRKVAEEARENKTSYENYLLCLLEQEVLARDESMQRQRLKQAAFPKMKTLDSFDFSAIPSLNKSLIIELYRGHYLGEASNVIFIGSIGTGKTHLATALGAQACLMGKRVKFYTTAELINELTAAYDNRSIAKLNQQLTRIDLLILDELGMVPYHQEGANLLFQVIAARHERHSTIITTNLEFKDWTQVFGSEQLTAALIDRLTHRCQIIQMNGESYRFKQSLQRKKKNKNAA